MARKTDYFLALQVAELSLKVAQLTSQLEALTEEHANCKKAAPEAN